MAVQRPALGGNKTDLIWASVVSAVVVVCLVIYIVFFAALASERGNLLLAALLGGMVGWVLGIFATPYNVKEEKRLAGLSGIAYAAVSGFILAKVEPLFVLLLGTADKPDVNQALLPQVAFAIIMMLDAVVLTYVTRSYSEEERQKKAKQ